MTPFEKAVEVMAEKLWCFENGLVFSEQNGFWQGRYRTRARVALTAALTALESEGWGAALTDACQLLDSVKMDWSKTGEWSAWDQSVRDRLSAISAELYRAVLSSSPKAQQEGE